MRRGRSTILGLLATLALVLSFGATVARPPAALAAPPPIACAPDSGSASISGTVTGIGSIPLNQVLVTAYTVYGDRGGYAYTDSSGNYQITGLIGGKYLVQFGAVTTYAGEWYDNQPGPDGTTAVTVPEGGALSGINAQLGIGARISGQVVKQGGGPLQNVRVDVYDASGRYVAGGYTDASGNYTTSPGLPAGGYRVRFNSVAGYLGQYYTDKDSLDTATVVNVAAAALQTGINATLARGASISGRVTIAASGLPASSVQVYASGNNGSGYDYTDASGNYVIDGLPSGSYELTASPLSDNINLRSAPRTVTVTMPNTTSNVNLTLAPGGTITGKVTAPGGAPLANITVFVGNQDGSYQNYVNTNASGVYTATAMPSGQYYVLFRPSNAIPEAYNNHPDFSQADLIPVTPPQTVGGINAVLATGGAVSGTVTDASTGLPIKDVFVEVLDLNGQRVETAFTQADGTYHTNTTLPTGDYLVRFNADERFASCGYVTEYYNNRPSQSTATHIRITAPAALANVDAQMERGSLIFGHVTDAASGKPITSGSIRVYDSSGAFVMFGRISFLGGYHTETALPSGSYRVQVTDYDGGYIDEFYNDKFTLGSANPVALSGPADRSGIDFALSKGALISGRVTAADTGAPFTDGYVEVYDGNGMDVGSAEIGTDGSYTVQSGLASGSYTVAAVPYGNGLTAGYGTTFYRSTILHNRATPVTVIAPNTTSAINIAVLHGVWIPSARR